MLLRFGPSAHSHLQAYRVVVPEPRRVETIQALDGFCSCRIDIPGTFEKVRSSEDLRLHRQPSDEILKAAARNRSNLIVMGTHGLTGADRLLMGSTTLGILQATAVPVLAVPSVAKKAAACAPSPSRPGRPIVAALELNGSSDENVDIAAHIARWFGRGSVSYHVLTEALTPVLAYPPQWQPR
jgi:hypothetical protein